MDWIVVTAREWEFHPYLWPSISSRSLEKRHTSSILFTIHVFEILLLLAECSVHLILSACQLWITFCFWHVLVYIILFYNWDPMCNIYILKYWKFGQFLNIYTCNKNREMWHQLLLNKLNQRLFTYSIIQYTF